MIRRLLDGCRTSFKYALLRTAGGVRKLGGGSPPRVLLTFDDGPHPDVTPAVLDRLRKWQARGVFFVVGRCLPRAPSLLARIIAEGHVVGNHSFAHWTGPSPWPRHYLRDVARCQEAVHALTGQRPRLFRPPLGRLCAGSLAVPGFLGLRLVHWSVDSGDWRLRTRAEAQARAEQLALQVRPGDVLLFHDDTPWVVPVLDILLPRLAAAGFDLRSIAATL